MSKLIALVATAVIVNGERTVIQPGEPLPELTEHDARELTGSGAALDSAEAAKQAKLAAKDETDAMADFNNARKNVLAEAASTATPPADKAATPPAGKAETPPAGKTAKKS